MTLPAVQKVQVTISSRGIKFTAEDASSMQATVFIQEHLCSAFAVDMKTVKEGFYFGLDRIIYPPAPMNPLTSTYNF